MLNINSINNGESLEENRNKMKLKTTKKQIRDNTRDNLYSVGYCELQHLLRYESPFAYSSGVYGWSCDYYQLSVDGQRIIISTGYSPTGKSIDYKTVKRWDESARDYQRNIKSWDLKEEMTKSILDNFLRTLINNN
tara:strand:+ start:396 stop:803 length:408 start_codon:yes stop_codon:yes gene_type:complete